jgi:HEAT repeat protein
MGDVGHYLPDTDAAHERQWNTTYRRRTGAALALMALGPEHQAGVPRLFDIISSLAVTNGENKMSMVAVASSFRFIGSEDRELIADLLGGLQDARIEVRLTTLWALFHLKPPPAAAFPLLTNIAADPQARFRGLAIRLLPKVGKDRPEVVGLLTAILTNPLNGRLRADAAEELEQLGTNALSAMPALEEAAEDPDPYVSKASRSAIKKLVDSGRGR